MIYTQKWSIVSFLEPVSVGMQFFWKDWPLHVTIASVFAVEWSKELLDELALVVKKYPTIPLAAVEDAQWGDTEKYHCAVMKQTSLMTDFHNEVLQLLLKYGAIFNEPQYNGDGFVPHSTYQKHSRVNVGETITLNSISIIDMFPQGDHLERVVTKTIEMNKNK